MVTPDAPLWEDETPTDSRVRCTECGVYSAAHEHDHPVPAPDGRIIALLLAAGGGAAAAQRHRR